MSEVIIRAARLEDTDEIVRIDQTSFTKPWSEQTMRTAIEKAQCGEYIALVAETNTTVCGFVIAWNVREEGEIATIAIDEPFRDQGIAQRLLEAALHEAARRGAEWMFLEVRPGNRTALHLYEKCGFQKVGLRKNYYRDGDDAVIMRKQTTE
ncbi:MAG TPA: ribosomal protein S18-alanine N-acetyltransferase [Abditibacteriaceae bacterium]|jgi:ribosomal-protein-alanine N-acetyltransferase